MKIKTLTVALALTLTPALGLAMGCNSSKHEQQAMSCATGTVYDAETNTCVQVNA